MIRYALIGLMLLCLWEKPAVADNKPETETARGAMLYDNHCLECHTRQVHWRKKKLVSDWKTLTATVDRWQTVSDLEWNASDIDEVSRYLNHQFYHYP